MSKLRTDTVIYSALLDWFLKKLPHVTSGYRNHKAACLESDRHNKAIGILVSQGVNRFSSYQGGSQLAGAEY